jgi:GT2 family glycosyltransferase
MNANIPSFEVDFGQHGNGLLYRREGWSEPEPRYTWSLGFVSSLELPRPDEPGDYMLELNVHPFTSDGKISVQKLRVVVNDVEVADFEVRVTSSLECQLPWSLIENRAAVSVSFLHPNAASRNAINGEPDDRVVAFAFQRVGLRRMHETAEGAVALALPQAARDDLSQQTILDPAKSVPTRLQGNVDVYGYNPSGGCWLFIGWVSCPWGEDELVEIVARFTDRAETGPVIVSFYDRPGLGGQGVGIVISMQNKPKKRQLTKSQLVSLDVETANFWLSVDGHEKEPVTAERLIRTLRPILLNSGVVGSFEKMLRRLPPELVLNGIATFVEGHVDLYAHDAALGGWFFLGWISQPWPNSEDHKAVARFADVERVGGLSGLFFDRHDLRGRGRGFILFMPGSATSSEEPLSLLSLDVDIQPSPVRLEGRAQQPVTISELVAAMQPHLEDAALRTQLAVFMPAMLQSVEPTEPTSFFEGHVDFYGYCARAGGWLFCGWVTSPWGDDHAPIITAQFVDGDVSGQLRSTFYSRNDVAGRGVGAVLFFSGMDDREHLMSLDVCFPDLVTQIYASDYAARSEDQLLDELKSILFDNELIPNDAGLRTLLFGETPATPDVDAADADLAGSSPFSGHVDVYGYLADAGMWFFCGWVTGPWAENDRPLNVIAQFENGLTSGDKTIATFYFREDVEGHGVGFILALASADEFRNNLISLQLEFAQFSTSLQTTAAGPSLSKQELVEWLTPLLTGAEANSNRARLHAMLLPEQSGAPGQKASQGFVDFYGYHTIGGGWLFCGWVSNKVQDALGPATFIAQFERGEVRGEAVSTYYARDDLGDRGSGIVLFIPGAGVALGGLLSIAIEADEFSFRVFPSATVQRLRESELIAGLRAIVAGAPVSLQREALLGILRRQGFAGTDTIAELSERVFFEFDEVIVCEPNAIVLIGWYLAKPGAVRSLRLRCGTLASAIDMDECVKIDRPDVLTAVGEQHGFDDFRCGFIAFLPNSVDGSSAPYIEIETRRGEVGYRTIPAPRLDGIAAMKRLLDCFDVRFLDVPKAYDRVIGPAIELLNKSRLKTRPNVAVIEFGARPVDPEFSVIIPLYGRIDFVEYQLALFSAHPPSRNFEFIYVLDDPSKRREAQFLFASAYERFGIPFRALLFDRNVGFAPANDIGLQYASGKYVCFLNSDAFPGTPDWLERLVARLKAHPEFGAIGPLLLYEDGSIQHQGMSFRELKEFGNWYFGHHPGKGLQLGDAKGIRECISITGACMVMERALAERTHGFDEAYAIGDFEDSDLCLKLHRMGLACAVDLEVHLYHLERKSQTASGRSWRMNLTLYNAWFHQRRWARAISAHPFAFELGPVKIEADVL